MRYDPHLPQIFDGEEFSRASRLWTHGYDMYTPTRGIVFHDYMKKMAEVECVLYWSVLCPRHISAALPLSRTCVLTLCCMFTGLG